MQSVPNRFCLETAGVLPQRLPTLLYDNLRIRAFRLDDAVDPAAAAFIRAQLDRFPADSRPLYPDEAER